MQKFTIKLRKVGLDIDKLKEYEEMRDKEKQFDTMRAQSKDGPPS